MKMHPLSKPIPGPLAIVLQIALLTGVVCGLMGGFYQSRQSRILSRSVSNVTAPPNLYLLTENNIWVYPDIEAQAQQRFPHTENYAAPQSGTANYRDFLYVFFVDVDRRIYYYGSGGAGIDRIDDATGKNKRRICNGDPRVIHVANGNIYYLTQLGDQQAIVSLPIMGGEPEIYALPFEDCTRINTLFVDDAGHIYFNDNHQIVRMDNMRGDNLRRYGELGSGKGQFHSPRSLVVDRKGRIYIADTGNNRILRMDDIQGTNEIALYVPNENKRYGVSQIALDSRDRIYVLADIPHEGYCLLRVDDMTGKGWTTLMERVPNDTLQFFIR